jgi:putative ABC transport system permease protein
VRTSVDPMTLSTAVRREVTAVDASEAAFEFRTMDQVVQKSMAAKGFLLGLLMVFAGIALTLAAIGIYGVMSYLVEQRTREIGIRIALGAGRGAVVRLVVRYGMTLGAIGIAIGLAVAVGLSRVLSSLLFGVQATDPATFVGVALVLGVVALVASWIPAHRATHIDPVNALRSE